MWKPVKGWEKLYQISDDGKLKRIATCTGKKIERLIVASIVTNGYPSYQLSNRKIHKQVSAHRLVADNFIGDIPKDMVVNHKNGIRTDSRLENLEIISQSDNCAKGKLWKGFEDGK